MSKCKVREKKRDQNDHCSLHVCTSVQMGTHKWMHICRQRWLHVHTQTQIIQKKTYTASLSLHIPPPVSLSVSHSPLLSLSLSVSHCLPLSLSLSPYPIYLFIYLFLYISIQWPLSVHMSWSLFKNEQIKLILLIFVYWKMFLFVCFFNLWPDGHSYLIGYFPFLRN